MTESQAPRRPWLQRLQRLLRGALLLTVAAAAFYGTLRLEDHLDRLEREVQRLESENADSAQRATQARAAHETLGTRVSALEGRLAQLSESVQGGRARVQAAAAELLMTAALERVQVGRDPAAAARLLTLADRRLAAAAEVRWSAVREALAAERLALLAVPVVDREGSALRLAALIRQSAQWPLQSSAPSDSTPPVPSAAPATPTGWVQRAWASLRQALAGMFSLRRETRERQPVLDPEQENLVRQLLLLKLEGARLALLREDADSFRELCGSASALLAQDYRTADAGVRAARAELDQLARLPLNPPLPETGRALTLLRDALDRAP